MSTYVVPSLLDQLALSLDKAGSVAPLVFAVGGMAYVSMSENVVGEGVAVGNTKWNVYSTLLGTLIGVAYWKENLTEYQMLGIGLSAIALYLLSS